MKGSYQETVILLKINTLCYRLLKANLAYSWVLYIAIAKPSVLPEISGSSAINILAKPGESFANIRNKSFSEIIYGIPWTIRTFMDAEGITFSIYVLTMNVLNIY